MNVSKVKQIHEFGQSIWLDFIDRKFIVSGGLQKLIDADGVKGVTSNPAIFEKAISNSLDKAIEVMARVKAAGIDMVAVAEQLEEEGIEKFNQPFQKLLGAIEIQKQGNQLD